MQKDYPAGKRRFYAPSEAGSVMSKPSPAVKRSSIKDLLEHQSTRDGSKKEEMNPYENYY